jgi:arsenate reductase
MNEIDIPSTFESQDIKTEEISDKQLDELYALTKSYEELFSRRAKLYKERDLKSKNLQEEDYRNLILEHYTFLKRPVIVNNEEIFIGSSPKTVAAAKESIHSK